MESEQLTERVVVSRLLATVDFAEPTSKLYCFVEEHVPPHELGAAHFSPTFTFVPLSQSLSVPVVIWNCVGGEMGYLHSLNDAVADCFFFPFAP